MTNVPLAICVYFLLHVPGANLLSLQFEAPTIFSKIYGLGAQIPFEILCFCWCFLRATPHCWWQDYTWADLYKILILFNKSMDSRWKRTMNTNDLVLCIRRIIRKDNWWLVGGFNSSEKYESVGIIIFPIFLESHNPAMFQATKQMIMNDPTNEYLEDHPTGCNWWIMVNHQPSLQCRGALKDRQQQILHPPEIGPKIGLYSMD